MGVEQNMQKVTSTSEINVLELLPQRPPFIMVDRLLSCSDTEAVTRFEVRKDNLFLSAGRLSEGGVVENVAQSCASRIGYIGRFHKRESVKIGVIGSITNFRINSLPKVGDIMTTTIVVEEDIFNMTLIDAKVEIDGKEIATGKMKISLTDKESEQV